MPIMVLLTMQACLTLLNHFLRKIFISTLTLSSFISFFIFFKDFTAVQYPMDLINQANIKFNTAHFISEFEKCETNGLIPNESNMKKNSGEFVLVNFCRPYPLKEKRTDLLNYSLMIQVPHFIEFKPYQFEGFSKEERDAFSKKSYFMSIYTVL